MQQVQPSIAQRAVTNVLRARTEEQYRRNLAASVFYSRHPLVLAYFDHTAADAISCKPFCDWVAQLPKAEFNAALLRAWVR